MSNINLLDGKDFSKEIDSSGPNLATPQNFQAPEPKPKPSPSTTEATPPPGSGKKVAQPSPLPPEHFAERSSFWPIFAGIVAGLVVIAFLIYLYTHYKGTDHTTTLVKKTLTDSTAVAAPSSENVATIAKTPKEKTKIVETLPIAGTGLEQGRRQMNGSAAILKDLLSALPAGIQLSFLRYDGSNYTLEAAAPTPDLFTQFEKNLHAQNSALLPISSSEQEVLAGSQVLTLRQISGKFQASGAIPAANAALPFAQTRKELLAQAQQFKLRLVEFAIAPAQAETVGGFRPATLKLLGNQERLTDFLQGVLSTYRNVGLNKIMVSTPSLMEQDNQQVNMVLDLDIYSE